MKELPTKMAIDWELQTSDDGHGDFPAGIPNPADQLQSNLEEKAEILDILIEDQTRSLTGRLNQSMGYHLLDNRYQARNSLAPKDVVEDDYSEDSHP